jgi:hypothetical protein
MPDRGLGYTQLQDQQSWPVYVGSSENIAEKIQALEALTVYFDTYDIRPAYVDVRWADHPVYGLSRQTANASARQP